MPDRYFFGKSIAALLRGISRASNYVTNRVALNCDHRVSQWMSNFTFTHSQYECREEKLLEEWKSPATFRIISYQRTFCSAELSRMVIQRLRMDLEIREHFPNKKEKHLINFFLFFKNKKNVSSCKKPKSNGRNMYLEELPPNLTSFVSHYYKKYATRTNA